MKQASDSLPPGQKTIQTRNVTRCKAIMRMATDPERRTPTMVVITGLAGTGKTIASQDYMESLTPDPYTALPACIKVNVKPRSTPRALAETILESLSEKSPNGRNIYEIANEAA